MTETTRKFWVNYQFNSYEGSGEGSMVCMAAGPVTEQVVREWKRLLGQQPELKRLGANVIIRTWTELESPAQPDAVLQAARAYMATSGENEDTPERAALRRAVAALEA
jgi:hypothetical protein